MTERLTQQKGFNSHITRQIFVKQTLRLIRTSFNKMFKPCPQPRAKSPYQPKLLQALIDSSDQENLSISSDNKPQDDFEQQWYCQDRSISRKSQYTNLFNNQDKRSVKSVYTSLSQQTVKVKPSADLIQTKNVKYSNPPTASQSHISKPETLNLTRFTQSKQPKLTTAIQQNELTSLSQKPKSSNSPNMAIKYDTLKLSEYNSKEIKKQEQLYQQNLKDFRQKFNSSKTSQNNQQNSQILMQQQKQQLEDYMDSLQAMKRSNLNRRHFSRKSLKKEVSTPSSRIKFLQQQRDPNSNQKQSPQIDLLQTDFSQLQRLRQELKRSKDIIKTLGLKNADLQKNLQMKQTKLLQLESEQNSRLTSGKGSKQKEQTERKVYAHINCYMKLRVKEFMEEIGTMKMSPLVERSLETFLQEIIQLNQATVANKVGNHKLQLQKKQPQLNNPLKQLSQNATPQRLTKSIFNTKTQIDYQKQQPHNNHQPASTQFGNRFQTNCPTSHITIGANRQNSFISTKPNPSPNIQGYTIKVDLSSNKQNITPNKKPAADDQLRQLQKSLQKLKAMEKQLSTPLPKNPFTTNKSHFVSNNNNNDEYKTEYSIVNRSQLSHLGRDQNNNNNSSVMNLSGNNLDRSKSRRKKIFAETNHK